MSSSSAARTCFTLLASQRNAGAVRDGTFWLDPDGAGGASPTQVVCDMANGGYNVVNLRRQIDVGSRHNDQRTTFTVANFGANAYRFGRVVADFEFAGELDDGECRPLPNVNPCDPIHASESLTFSPPTTHSRLQLALNKGCLG